MNFSLPSENVKFLASTICFSFFSHSSFDGILIPEESSSLNSGSVGGLLSTLEILQECIRRFAVATLK